MFLFHETLSAAEKRLFFKVHKEAVEEFRLQEFLSIGSETGDAVIPSSWDHWGFQQNKFLSLFQVTSVWPQRQSHRHPQILDSARLCVSELAAAGNTIR